MVLEANEPTRRMCTSSVLQDMLFIDCGEVEVWSADMSKLYRLLRAGDYMGEIALLTRERRTAHCKAITYAELWSLSRDDLTNLFQDAPEMEERMHQCAQERLMAHMQPLQESHDDSSQEGIEPAHSEDVEAEQSLAILSVDEESRPSMEPVCKSERPGMEPVCKSEPRLAPHTPQRSSRSERDSLFVRLAGCTNYEPGTSQAQSAHVVSRARAAGMLWGSHVSIRACFHPSPTAGYVMVDRSSCLRSEG